MKSTKLHTILGQLSKPKINRFLKFLASPYLNSKTEIEELVKEIIASEEEHSREDLFTLLFPNEKYDDRKLRKLFSDSITKFEEFLVIEHLKSDKLLYHQVLLQEINESKVNALQEKSKKNALNYFERFSEKAGDYYAHKYKLEKNIFNLDTEYEKRKIKKGDKRNLNIKQLNLELDQYYVIEKLRLACDLISWQRIFKIQERPFDIEIILRMLERNDLLENVVIQAYRSVYLMLIGREEEDHYKSLKQTIFKEKSSFPLVELKEIFDSMLTYCIGKFSSDNQFLNEALELYDFGIEQGILLINDHITPITFRNYVILGLRIGKTKKVENFIAQKEHLLDDRERENTINFCKARVFWYKKDWQSVIQQLAIVGFEDSYYYYVNSKIMLISAYYELDEFDTIEYTLDSFYSYLLRNKELNEQRNNAYKLYISNTRRLLKIRPGDTKALQKLKVVIEEESRPMNGKNWLLEKIEEQLK